MEAVIKQNLGKIVGADNVGDSSIDLVAYSYDASDYDHRPMGAVRPTSAEQVAEVVKLANEHGLHLIPRGAGTGLAGGARCPVLGGLVVDLSRMNKILEIGITDRLALVEPGVVYMDLQSALAPYGDSFPFRPGQRQGLHPGRQRGHQRRGLRAAKYGVTRDYVLGLKVVLPDGRIMKTGSRCMKSSSGYDLTRLFVGSEGTLGIITRTCSQNQPQTLGNQDSGVAFSPGFMTRDRQWRTLSARGPCPAYWSLWMSTPSVRSGSRRRWTSPRPKPCSWWKRTDSPKKNRRIRWTKPSRPWETTGPSTYATLNRSRRPKTCGAFAR